MQVWVGRCGCGWVGVGVGGCRCWGGWPTLTNPYSYPMAMGGLLWISGWGHAKSLEIQ